MKTTINLYQAEFHPKLSLLNLNLVLVSWGIVLLLCLAAYSYLAFEQKAATQKHNQIEQEQQQQVALFKQLQTELDNLIVDPKLLEKINQQQQTINFKQQILNELTQQKSSTFTGFSNLMLGLAKQHKAGLWLTHIQIDGREVNLQGAAIESAIIPQWVNRLSKTQYFKGQQFSDTRFYRDKDDQLNFELSSGKLNKDNEIAANE